MATYFFENITPQQAATYTASDTLVASYPTENPGRVMVGQTTDGTTYITSLMTGRSATSPGFAGESVIFPFGNLELGTTGADNRTAGSGDDALYGFAGDDILNGAAGADTLVGGKGADTLSGGAGADTFVFNYNFNGSDTSTDENALEKILDWSQADTLRFSLPGDPLFSATSTNYAEGTAANYAAALSLANDTFGGQNPSYAGGTIFFMAVQVGADVVVFVQRADTSAADHAIKLVGVTLDSLDYRNLSDTGALGAQTLTGGANDDSLAGAGGDDSLSGGDGADTLSGLDGNDTLVGGAGNDDLGGGNGVNTVDFSDAAQGLNVDLSGSFIEVSPRSGETDRIGGFQNFVAGGFNDTISGDSAANGLDGGAGNDVLSGRDGADTLRGQDGSDTLSGGAGADRLEGGAGNDRLVGGAGADSYYGGAGADVFSIAAGEAGTAISTLDRIFDWDSSDTLELSAAPGGSDYMELTASTYEQALSLANQQISSGQVNFVAVEIGSDLVLFADSRKDNGQADDAIVLAGRSLADIDGGRISGTAGGADNAVTGTPGNDAINSSGLVLGVGGDDTLTTPGGQATFDGGEGNDSVVGGNGQDSLYGGAGADTINSAVAGAGQDANDRLDGGAGNDSITTFGGADNLLGGDGDDTLAARDHLPLFVGAYTVDGGAGVDRLDYSGVTFQYIAGDMRGLTLSLTGSGGRDVVTGVEWLVGTSHNDILLGTSGAETLQGGAADDEIRGGGGGDRLDGGDGFDTVTFVDVAGAVSVNMATGVTQGSGWTGSIAAVERVLAGANADSLTGDGQANNLSGGGGADVLDGGSGDDTLVGGAGADSLTGGAGADLFQIAAGHSGVVSGQTDVITDWSSNDKLLMAAQAASGFSYVELSAGNYANAASLANAHISAGGVNYVAVQVGGDVVVFVDSADDNGVADDAVVLLGRTLADISTTNFAAPAAVTPPAAPSGTTGTTGTAGDDNLINRGPRTTVTGLAGNDTLFAGFSADTLEGGTGNDVLVGNGAGAVVASYAHATSAVYVDLNISGVQAVGGGEGIDTLFDISGLLGGAYNDTLVGVAGASGFLSVQISGGAGADSIVGSAAMYETLLGGDGADTITGGGASTQIEGGAGDDSLSGGGFYTVQGNDGADFIETIGNANGGAGSDTISAVNATHNVQLYGGPGDDRIVGSGYDDAIFAGSGVNTILAGAGNDVINVSDSSGNDTAPGAGSFDGGAGVDTLNYGWAPAASVNLATGVATSGGATATVSGFEAVTGSVGADSIVGGGGNETLVGGKGSDTLEGGGGNDLLMGYQEAQADPDSGNVVRGGDGADSIVGGQGADSLAGDAGDDTIAGLDGDDTIDGGAGIDTVELRSLSSVVVAALGPNEYTATGVVLTEEGEGVLLNVENLTGGYSTDFLVGDDAVNVLRGESGNDTLIGRGGADTLTGGSGDDYFVFGPGNSGVTAGQVDVIADWAAGDRLVFATAATAGTYLEATAADFGAALALANTEIASGARNYVAVAVGADVVLFADTAGNDGTAEDAIVLRGRTLADIDASMIVAPPITAPDIEEEETGPPPSGGGGGGGDGGGGGGGGGGGDSGPPPSPPPSGGGGGGGASGDIFPTPQMRGSESDDVMVLSSSVDSYDAGAGNDSVVGNAASNLLFGGDGDDTVAAGQGNDTIVGGEGTSYLRGDEGDDRIIGGSGFDDINGNMGEDSINGGLGDDWVVGGKGNDVIFGETGDDLAYGNIGEDIVGGGVGNDIVRGGQGNDVVRGDNGDDFVSGDRGNDTMEGGLGADILHTFSEAGLDYVVGFNAAEGDRVMVDPGTVYTVSQQGANVVIDMGGDNRMVLENVQLSSLSPGWIFGA